MVKKSVNLEPDAEHDAGATDVGKGALDASHLFALIQAYVEAVDAHARRT